MLQHATERWQCCMPFKALVQKLLPADFLAPSAASCQLYVEGSRDKTWVGSGECCIRAQLREQQHLQTLAWSRAALFALLLEPAMASCRHRPAACC